MYNWRKFFILFYGLVMNITNFKIVRVRRRNRVFGTEIARVLKIPATTPIDPHCPPPFQYRQRVMYVTRVKRMSYPACSEVTKARIQLWKHRKIQYFLLRHFSCLLLFHIYRFPITLYYNWQNYSYDRNIFQSYEQ